jgi:hypothetical protein
MDPGNEPIHYDRRLFIIERVPLSTFFSEKRTCFCGLRRLNGLLLIECGPEIAFGLSIQVIKGGSL